MNWIKNFVRPKIRGLLGTKRELPENMWIKDPETGQMVFYKDLEANQFVVPGSDYHMKMSARARLAHLFDDGKTEHFFTVSYQWFDQKKSIVKYAVATVIPSQNRTIVNSEGFYGFDPFNDRLYVLGAFRNGMSGFGSVGVFDH